MRLFYVVPGLVLGALLLACSPQERVQVTAQSSAEQPNQPLTAPPRAPVYMVYGYEVINTYPHDPAAFTQGLVYFQGAFFESTGLNGSSSLRKVELETGRVLKKVDVPAQYFAEGLALFNGRLLQLTWQNQVGFVYDQETFQPLGSFNYSGEGWGLTHDGKSLILSDGTSQIRFLDPQTFQVQRAINVLDHGQPVVRLNELEYVNGELLANIWLTNRIARINPADGTVTSWIDLTGLLPAPDSARADVLNGIAYDAASDRLFVTGKLWPKLFEIRLKSARNEVRR